MLIQDALQSQAYTIAPQLARSASMKSAQPNPYQAAANALSPLAALAYEHDFTELQVSSEQTVLGFRKDNSLALRAVSRFNYHSSVERVSMSLTFSAESLGLTAKDFAGTNGQPIQFAFSAASLQQTVETHQSSKIVRPTRSTEDILMDIGKALSKALRGQGDKSIHLQLDEEALQALSGDEKLQSLMSMLMSLIAYVNSVKNFNGEREHHLIQVSGKGNPYVDYEESANIEEEGYQVDFNFTILPPAQAETDTSPAQIAGKGGKS